MSDTMTETDADECVPGESSPLVGSPAESWANNEHEHERENGLSETKSTWYLILLTLSIGG